MKEQFRTKKFQQKNVILLDKIKEILEEFSMQGFRVTLRQLYYQLVSRDIIPNRISAYAKLSGLLTDARYNGEIDWNAIEDRTRKPNIPNTFSDIKDLINSAVSSYKLDRWEEQEYYIELWTEKDALSSVIQPIAKKYQIPFIVNRGYSSTSAMYVAKERIREKLRNGVWEEVYGKGRKCIILYLGDHDPSGLDMDRDIRDRLKEFEIDIEVIRIGLTQEQIQQYNPPTNPAKTTDPRGTGYIEEFGNTSWEVDALSPKVLQELIEKFVKYYLDIEKFEQVKEKEQEDIKRVVEFAEELNEGDGDGD